MKNNIKEKEDCFLGCKIAEQITDVMKADSNNSSLDDYPELKVWLENDETAGRIIEKLSSEDKFDELCKKFTIDNDKQRLINSIEKKRRNTRYFTILKMTSSVAALFILSFYFLIPDNKTSNTQTEKVAAITAKETTIELSKPTLILDNGDKIDLTTTQNIGHAIEKSSDNKLNYKNVKADVISYNTLITPKLCIYNIELSDGTIVTLNACSELRYPVEFKGDKREVFLKGEGYFDVKKGKDPFVIHSENMAVKVYGTRFNINSYNKENIQTILIEGSIGVTIDATSTETMITPNQMLTTDSKGAISLEQVDVTKYTTWMNGEIISYQQPLSSLLDKVSKWYGVEFVCTEEVKNINISTSLSTDLPLSEVLAAIEKITGININKTKEDKYMVL